MKLTKIVICCLLMISCSYVDKTEPESVQKMRQHQDSADSWYAEIKGNITTFYIIRESNQQVWSCTIDIAGYITECVKK